MAETNGISMDDLRKILAEQSKQNAEQLKVVIGELQKPTVLEQRALDREAKELKDKNEERKTNAVGVIQVMKDKAFNQTVCSHKHAAAEGGHSHGVYVQEKAPSLGYILCQKCSVKVRPGVRPETNADFGAVYDTAMFNRLFQELPTTQEMFA